MATKLTTVSTRHTQSLTDFRQRAAETLDRLNRTDEAEIITVNGEARAVLLSPKQFDQLTSDAVRASDLQAMQQSLQQIRAGKGIELDEALDGIRKKLTQKQTTGGRRR